MTSHRFVSSMPVPWRTAIGSSTTVQRPSWSASTAGFGGLAAWCWPPIVSLVIALLLEIPHEIALAQADRGMTFVGMFWSAHDVSQYLAAMREGAAGSWLITDHLTGEPHKPALMYGMYVLLGKVTALVGADFERMYVLAASVGRFLLLLALYAATGLVTAWDGRRRLAFCLVVFGSGLSAVLGTGANVAGVAIPTAATDLNQVEVSTFLTLFTAPHLMVGLSLSLGIARMVAMAWGGSKAAAVGAVVMAGALGIVNPFSLATLCAVLTAFSVVQAVRRELALAGVVASAGVVTVAAPFLLYSLLVFTADPFWGATYGRQNKTLTDSPIELLFGFGLLVPLAIVGAWSVRRELTSGRLLVLSWIVVSVALMYLPVGFQRRFSFGLHPMLGLVAALGLLTFWTWMRSTRGVSGSMLRIAGAVLLGPALFGSSVLLYAAGLAEASRGASAVTNVRPESAGATFQPASLWAAGSWLTTQMEPDDVVLAHTITGNILAGIVPGRAYLGHWVATLNFAQKQQEMIWFYAAPLDDERLRFLRDRQIKFVVYGPHEHAIGAVRPDNSASSGSYDATLLGASSTTVLEPVYDVDGIAIYQVRPRGG
jgi:hypothetical protein